MSLRVDGKAILESLAENKSVSAQLYRRFAADGELGDPYFETMARDSDELHAIFLDLAKQAEADGGWAVDKEDYHYFRLRLGRTLLSDPEKLSDRAKKVKSQMDVLELAERVECGTLEILRELEDMVPRFAPKELKAMQEQAKAHLKNITEGIRELS